MSYHYDVPSLGSSHLLRVKFVTTNYRNESFYLIVNLPIDNILKLENLSFYQIFYSFFQ